MCFSTARGFICFTPRPEFRAASARRSGTGAGGGEAAKVKAGAEDASTAGRGGGFWKPVRFDNSDLLVLVQFHYLFLFYEANFEVRLKMSKGNRKCRNSKFLS